MTGTFRLWLWTVLTGSRLKALVLEGERLLIAARQTEALEFFRTVSREWPSRPEGYEGMGKVYQTMGLRLEANREKTIAEALVKLDDSPDDVKVRTELAQALVEKEMYGWAAAHMSHVTKLAPRDTEILRLAARVFTLNRNYDKAVDALYGVLQREPLDPDLYQQLSQNLRATHNTQEAAKASALSEALRAVNNDPGNSEVVDRAVRQFQASGQRRLCLALVERSIKGNPNKAGLFRLQGELLLDERNSKHAVLALRKAVDMDPTDQKAHRLLGRAYEIEGQIDNAEHHLSLAQEMDTARKSDDPLDAELVVVRVLLDADHLDQARKRAEAMAAEHRDNWRAPHVLGLVQKKLGKTGEALESFQRARRLNQRAAEPRMEIAWLLSEHGQALEAIGEARQAVQLAPREPEVRRSLAQILRAHGYMDQAIEEEDLADSLTKKNE